MTHAVAGGNGGQASCLVWWARTSSYMPGLGSLLGASELVRRDLYSREEDRLRFTVSAALLRLAVAHQLDTEARDVEVTRNCPDCPLPHGRPRVEGVRDVSVSYAADVVVVAVSEGTAVGVDVEAASPLSPQRAAVLRRALGNDELREFDGVSGSARENWLLRRWTYKEAVVKATADGLRTPLPGVQVSEASGMARLISYPGRPELPDSRVELTPLKVPAGYAAPESMASAAFLVDGGMSLHRVRVRVRDGRELFPSERHTA
ncbi:4'-phosphopantetheinyl transferase superfamily protein [Streptomyces sp. NPDC020807]|uniref:4'-phosphopantetheinyl transferase family protein n=1 Tax=Streptomyces sp. NPDC020807 TaxID=3155119 RepID=UPI0033E0B71B